MIAGNIKSWKTLGKPFPRSGQGNVVKATRADLSDTGIYVLKTMHEGGRRKKERQQRFENEIEALRRLDNPHILKIVDYGYDSRGNPYLVTPFCPNGTLGDRPLPEVPPIDALRLFIPICQAVAHAHGANVIHRDLKPRNIFLDSDNKPVVGDFGLCFLLDGEIEDGNRITRTMEVAAPLWFGAPEARDGRLDDVTKAADVYSLGKILYWLLGRRIFDRENHRADKFKLGKNLSDRREYELIHELLDRTIIENPPERLEDGAVVLRAARELLRVLEGKGRPILKHFEHRCDFCGQGTYVFQNGPEDTQANSNAGRSLGLGTAQYPSPAQYSDVVWMVAICNKCSHVQLFRPDQVKGAADLWNRKT
jgi:serine/threonine protein kinase